MRHKVFVVYVKWANQGRKSYEFDTLKSAIESVWVLRYSQDVVREIKIKSEWREPPEWLEHVARSLAGLT